MLEYPGARFPVEETIGFRRSRISCPTMFPMASPMILIPSASCRGSAFSASLSFLRFSISSKNLLDLASSSGSFSLSFEDKGSRSVRGGNGGLRGCGDGAAVVAGVGCLDGFLEAVLFRVRGFSVCVPDIGSSVNQDARGE